LLWVAFLVLPFAGVFKPATGSIDYERGHRLWAEAFDWASKQDSHRSLRQKRRQERKEGLVGGALGVASKLGGVGGKFGLKVGGKALALGKGGASLVKGGLKKIRGRSAKKAPDGSIVGGEGGVDYEKLEEELEETREMIADAEAGLAASSAEEDSGMRKQMRAIHERLLASPCGTWYGTAASWCGNVYHVLAQWQVYYDALTFPMKQGNQQNRLFSLLTWDTWMFGLCTALFFFMMLKAEWTREAMAAMERGEDLYRHSLYHFWLVMVDMTMIFSGDFWTRWRTQITYQVIKLLFALSTFPFFIFILGPFGKLFAHTDATAYTRNGRMVLPDANGLSAYLQWLKEDILGTHRWAMELETRFPARDLKRLRKAVTDGEVFLEKAWQRPARALAVTRKKKLEIDALLAEIVTKEKASAALYQKCFPDKVLVDEYVAKIAKDLADALYEEESVKPTGKGKGK